MLGSVALGKPGCMLASMALGIHRANWELEAACTAAALVITSRAGKGLGGTCAEAPEVAVANGRGRILFCFCLE